MLIFKIINEDNKMKKCYWTLYQIFFAFLLIFSVSCSQDKKNNGESHDLVKKLPNQLYKVFSGKTQLLVDPDVGGRILSLTFNNKEILTDDAVHPENFGSTLWTSPQKEWGWPPAPVLDVKPYQIINQVESLVLVSKEDVSSGYQFRKEIKPIPDKNAFIIHYTIKNISDTIKKVAPWEVTRVPVDGLSFFPGKNEEILSRSNLPVVVEKDIIWFDYKKVDIDRSKKLFANGKEGWLAHVHENILFVKVFPDINPDQTAPGEEEVEIFASGESPYIELENQGIYQELLPKDSLIWPVTWHLASIPDSVEAESKNMELINMVRDIISK